MRFAIRIHPERADDGNRTRIARLEVWNTYRCTTSAEHGEDGIRTHVPRRTNGFQDRLVMAASIPLLIRHPASCALDSYGVCRMPIIYSAAAQRLHADTACEHHINVRVGGDFPATMRVHTQYPARSQMQAPAARTRIFQSSPSCKDSLQLRNIAGAGFEPALLAYGASEQPDRSLPHD